MPFHERLSLEQLESLPSVFLQLPLASELETRASMSGRTLQHARGHFKRAEIVDGWGAAAAISDVRKADMPSCDSFLTRRRTGATAARALLPSGTLPRCAGKSSPSASTLSPMTWT